MRILYWSCSHESDDCTAFCFYYCHIFTIVNYKYLFSHISKESMAVKGFEQSIDSEFIIIYGKEENLKEKWEKLREFV